MSSDTASSFSSSSLYPSVAIQQRLYEIPYGQNHLTIGTVPRETIIYDKYAAILTADKRYGCAKCAGVVFDRKSSKLGPCLEKHVALAHPGESMDELKVAMPCSYRLRRRVKIARSQTVTEDGETVGEEVEEMTPYGYEMELLKIGNPYRMSPYDTGTSVSIPINDSQDVKNSVYPDLDSIPLWGRNL